ncbi:magnesium transporter [Ketobacter alkanivorans]|uniref:Magnesium transporter n=1 Tax=Ketobacter alkanivorans TaxID=1917421 RepID=A0A2K9LLC6_9GAMM|nr:magnesium transporter [Ketobacter alkanivorans]AUM12981.1 magnesium transporter [Ketobacter alkanivorans]MCP5016030.1 magnesium transporter [Ketobacter sp.]
MTDELSDLIGELVDTTADEQDQVIRQIVATREPEEVALLLESLPLAVRLDAWSKVPADDKLDILLTMRGDPRESLLDNMTLQELDALFDGMAAEDLVELSESLPRRMVDRALWVMDEQQRHYFEGAKQYRDDQIGRWVSHELLVLPTNARVRDGMRLLRRELPDYVDTVFLVNRAGHFSEAVRIGKIIASPDHLPLVDLSEDVFTVLEGQEDSVDASVKVQQSGFSALPVVDDTGKLLGRIDVGTAGELVNTYYEGQLMAGAGMDENEDLFAPVVKSARSRALWLGINLLTAFMASWFIGLFEATLQQVVALAVLMPVVASMGGIAGSQTLTLIIRGLAMGQVTSANLKALAKKELSVGGLNGVLWAIVIGLVASVWFGSPVIGVVIALAILVNIVAAAFSGIAVPVLLDKFKLDPALSGSVVLTTVTDIVGFVAFLGLGTLLLV